MTKAKYLLGASYSSLLCEWLACILIFVLVLTPACNTIPSNCIVAKTYEDGSINWLVCYDSSPQSETHYEFARNSDTLTIIKYNMLDSNKIYPDFIKLYEENQLYHAIYYDQKDTSKRYEYYLNNEEGYKDYEYRKNGHYYYTKRIDLNDSLIGVHVSPNFEFVDQDLHDKEFVFEVILPIPDSLRLYQGVMLKYMIYYNENELCADSMKIISKDVGKIELTCDPKNIKEIYFLNDTVKLELRTEIKTSIYHDFRFLEFYSILE
jgi:hypothetical protein